VTFDYTRDHFGQKRHISAIIISSVTWFFARRSLEDRVRVSFPLGGFARRQVISLKGARSKMSGLFCRKKHPISKATFLFPTTRVSLCSALEQADNKLPARLAGYSERRTWTLTVDCRWTYETKRPFSVKKGQNHLLWGHVTARKFQLGQHRFSFST